MATDDWMCAQQLLRAWPAVPKDYPADGTCRRLRDALLAVTTGEAGWRDIASLVRQILLAEQARHGTQVPLTVPQATGLPTREQWQQMDCMAIPDGPMLSLSAQLWHPPVGQGENGEAAQADMLMVYGQQWQRPLQPIAADPFWSAALGHNRYLSAGQRQAARTVVMAPPGSTTILCLPTGHGKTDVALAPTLLSGGDHGVTVIVVPTVVLALDMEERVRRLLTGHDRNAGRRRYAYTGDLPLEDKQDIRHAVRTGRQRVLITSPEALEWGLGDALARAAEAGYLRYLIIDEAHLVDQWGTEFRPQFQTMASQRLTWLAKAPAGKQVATLAMSATLTQRQVQTLVDLFHSDRVALVWASALRHEPSFYIEHYDDESARQAAVISAVGLLPRPLVLYTATRKAATSWATVLHRAGFARLARVTGDATDEERQAAIDGWRGLVGAATQFDIIVGTSAFGLGVNMDDVRSVVHACIPETVDRLYQEVGRGGRDGHPCVAFVATTPADLPVATQLNKQTVIGDQLGWGRWRSMQMGATPLGSRTYAVRIDTVPSHVPRQSTQNQQWNVRTLNLMTRAGLIQLRAPAPPHRGDDETDASYQERLEQFFAEISTRTDVEIIDPATNRPEHWSRAVSAQRKVVAAEQDAALDAVKHLLTGKRCVADILADHYRLNWHGGRLTTRINCRGCPRCRTTASANLDQEAGLFRSAPDPFPAVHPWRGTRDPLAAVRSGASWLSLYWTDEQMRRDLLPQLLSRLARRGMAVFGGAGLSPQMAADLQDGARPWPVIVDDDDDLVVNYPDPIAWVMDDAMSMPAAIIDRMGTDDVTYLVHPGDLPAPGRPSTRLTTICHAPLSIVTALGAL